MIDVVYLAYFNKEIGYDIKIVERFIRTYKAIPAGMEHSLVIIAKNISDDATYVKLVEIANDVGAKIIDLPDDGYDIGAYFRVAKLLDSEYVLFLGSTIQIVHPNWLKFLYEAFKKDNKTQLVGAMGSWGDMKDEIFPNPHIRTSSFMMKRELFLEYALTQKFPQTKEDTYEIEHGKYSLTNFILDKGYNAVVVNPDGDIYMPEDWVFSATFASPGWRAFFADKQIMEYLMFDDNKRRKKERAVWGQSLKNTDIRIFVSYHKEALPLESIVYEPVFSGKKYFDKTVCALRDDTKTNISEKSEYMGELTKHYWIWKNYLSRLRSEYVGFAHYNRYLDFNISDNLEMLFQPKFILDFKSMFEKYTQENILAKIRGYDVVVPQKFVGSRSVYELFLDSSPREDMDMAIDILSQLYPEYKKSAQEVLAGNSLYACLIFVMKKELINEYFTWLFSLLELLEKRTHWESFYKFSGIRTAVNIAEVMFNVWLNHNVKVKNVKILETTSVFINSAITDFLDSCKEILQSVKSIEPTKPENFVV